MQLILSKAKASKPKEQIKSDNSFFIFVNLFYLQNLYKNPLT